MKKSIIKKITALAACAAMAMPVFTQVVSASATEPTIPYVVEERSLDMATASLQQEVDISNNYTYQEQNDTLLCWAACSSMMFKPIFGNTVTQSYMVNAVFNSPTANQMASIGDIRTVFNSLNSNSNGNYLMISQSTNLLSYIKSSINNSRAVYLSTSYTKNSTTHYHAVLCVGYRKYSNNTYTFYIYDPAIVYPNSSHSNREYWTGTFSSNTYTVPSDAPVYGTVTINSLFYITT